MTGLATFTYKPESWMDSAACVGHPPEWWYPDDRGPGGERTSETTRAAKAICGGCPVRLKCLDYAMRSEPGWTKFGIFGGLTADARRGLEQDTA